MAGQCDACKWLEHDCRGSAPVARPRRAGDEGQDHCVGSLADGGSPAAAPVFWPERTGPRAGRRLVAASAILVGGDPGIGKSTLLLQATAAFARAGARAACIYRGEEAAAQVRLRAARLGLSDAPVQLGAETHLRDILTTLDAERPDLVGDRFRSRPCGWITVDSAPGSVAQVSRGSP